MMTLVYHRDFLPWLERLRDKRARERIASRIDRLADGNAGLHRHLSEGICELKIDYGPGYRVYFMRRGDTMVVLLCGGDKGSQVKDIEKAKRIGRIWED